MLTGVRQDWTLNKGFSMLDEELYSEDDKAFMRKMIENQPENMNYEEILNHSWK